MCQKASYLVYQQNDYLVYQPVYHTCAKVNEMYQNSLGMMPSVLNTDPIPSVPKCNWCTKRNDCNKRTESDQEWS